MDKLVELSTGFIDPLHPVSEYSNGMVCISGSLKDNYNKLLQLWGKQDDENFVRFGPMLGRLILEQSLAIIIGRFDPIRFLALVRGSKSTDFVMGQQNPSSFNWTRDVHPDIAPPPSWWTQKEITKLQSRSLLNGHLADYLFCSCHNDVIDGLSDFTASLQAVPRWISDLLNIEEGISVLAQLRTRSKTSYSTLSKGIHFEFFEGNNTQLSLSSTTEAIRDAIITVATTALYSHYSDISLQRINRNIALSNFFSVIEKFDQTNTQAN